MPSAARSGGSGGVFHGNAAAEGLEAGDEALRFAVGVGAALEVVGAEVVIRCAGGQHVQMMTRIALGGGLLVACGGQVLPRVQRRRSSDIQGACSSTIRRVA